MQHLLIAQSLSGILAQNAILNLFADDGDDDADRLLVMNDGDGARLLMDLYVTYVSEYDFSNFPRLMKNVDRLLYKARGNKAFTHEDRRAAEEAEPDMPKRGKKKKRAAAPAPAPVSDMPSDMPVTAMLMAQALTACMPR